MMSTNIESSKMENSTILREIADLDVTAPVTVSISFEDDFEETPIKTEIVTDDYREENHVTTVSAFFPIPKPKPDIKAKALPEEQGNEIIAQNNFQDTPPHQPDILQDELPAGDKLKKRKTKNAQMCESKKSKTISELTNDLGNKSSLETFSHIKTYNIQHDTSPTASENALSNSIVTAIESNQLDLNFDANGLQQTDVDKINAYITNCLAELSENMRHVILAYGAYRRQQITKEAYVKVKLHKFNLSYKTVITMLVPEENNTEFISTFLNDSVQRANKKTSCMHGYQDYANLLYELFLWTKKKQQQTRAATLNDVSQLPMPVQSNVEIGSKVNKNLTQDKRNDNVQIDSSNTNAEGANVCIFSSGPPERAIRINIDPILNKYLQMTQNHSTNTNQALSEPSKINPQGSNNTSTTPLTKTASDRLPRNVAKSKKPAQQLIQPTTAKAPHLASSHLQQYSMSNYITSPQQATAQARSLQIQLENPTLVNHLTQPIQSVQLPQHGYTQHFEPRSLHAKPPPPYDRSRHSQGHSGQQQHMPSQYNTVSQTQSPPTQFQRPHYFQPQLGSQPQQLQSQFGHSQVPVIQYNQARQPQVPHQTSKQSSQQGSEQYRQHPHSQATEYWPSVTELLTTPPPYPNSEQPLVGQWQSNNQEPQQLLPPSTPRTEWHQGLNAIYQAGQVNTLTQKGAPRSASTDSGFISPLNFNASTNQTMPTSPEEPETPMPMIVHVTSLSDKAAFVELGKCVVCKKTTKQMCMGCMKIYYCNYQCQSVDWATHAPHCTQQNTDEYTRF